MKKEYISDVWQLKQKGHENFECKRQILRLPLNLTPLL